MYKHYASNWDKFKHALAQIFDVKSSVFNDSEIYLI